METFTDRVVKFEETRLRVYAHQLRIGNLVRCHGNVIVVDGARIHDMSNGVDSGEEPVFIDLNWLKRFKLDSPKLINGKFINVQKCHWADRGYLVDGVIYVKYLHELQNAIFLFTKQDIEID